MSQQEWCMPLSLALQASLVYRAEFHDSQGHTKKSCHKKTKKEDHLCDHL